MSLNASGDGLLSLDESFYAPTSDALSFFLTETRIDCEAALKDHLIDVQAKAYKVSYLTIFFILPLHI
jgi:hypothetical protein